MGFRERERERREKVVMLKFRRGNFDGNEMGVFWLTVVA